MFVVTLHSFEGSAAESAEPDKAWLYNDFAKATQARDLINRLLAKHTDSQYCFLTEINSINAVVTNPHITALLEQLEAEFE